MGATLFDGDGNVLDVDRNIRILRGERKHRLICGRLECSHDKNVPAETVRFTRRLDLYRVSTGVLLGHELAVNTEDCGRLERF